MSEDELAALARRAMDDGVETDALPAIRDGATRLHSALLWQWTGLLHRAIDEHERALEAFEIAARLAPADALVMQGWAQTAHEAGVPAAHLFERALRLAPNAGPILIGLAAARNAEGDGEGAERDYRTILERSPMWLDGHIQLSQLIATHGRPDDVTASVERAIARMPRQPALWETLLNIELRRGRYDSLMPIVERARRTGVESPEFAAYEGIHAAQFDDRVEPPALFDAAPRALDSLLATWRVRHFLRVGRADLALPILDKGLQGPGADALWPYAATVWQVTDDPRSAWLEHDGALVQTIDLSGALGNIDAIADYLRTLHVATGEYLDQSVRGGTQTDGPLFCRIDPVVRHLRAVASDAVRDYVADLPPIDPAHPTLAHARDRMVRFAGSWSVRLRSKGHHSNHVHPEGWISSALYIALPRRAADDRDDSGWFTIGQPDGTLDLGIDPRRTIEPGVGKLVLFPSWMWHGTVPFSSGERLTVAFDVSKPPQEAAR